MLAKVFRPGMHQEGFEITVFVLGVAKDSPFVGAITSAGLSISMHRFDEVGSSFRGDVVFHRDEYRANVLRIDCYEPTAKVGTRQSFHGVTSTARYGFEQTLPGPPYKPPPGFPVTLDESYANLGDS